MFQGIGQDLATAIIIYVVITCALFFIAFDLCFRIINKHKNEIAKDITDTVKDMIGSAPVLLAKPQQLAASSTRTIATLGANRPYFKCASHS